MLSLPMSNYTMCKPYTTKISEFEMYKLEIGRVTILIVINCLENTTSILIKNKIKYHDLHLFLKNV